MELFRLLELLEHRVLQGNTRREIGKVTNDSRKVETGDVFVCVRGYQVDGHDKIPEALENRVGAIVIARNVSSSYYACSTDVTVIEVLDTRYALAVMAAAYYDNPAKKLKIIGITGTKGKSTVAGMLHQILNSSGYKTGLIGTIQVDTGKNVYKSLNTTPDSLDIQYYLKEMLESGCEYVVMEVSSQALKLQRVAGIIFEIGIFTNMGWDHIGPLEHADFEEYLFWKKQLFTCCRKGIGNIDDAYYPIIFDRTLCEKITYSIKESSADYFADDIHMCSDISSFGSNYICKEKEQRYAIVLPIPGEFNVYNSLAVTAALRQLKVPATHIVSGMREVVIPGRVEKIGGISDCMLYIDYAHNGMSLEKLLKTFRAYEPKRIVVVFGCGGNRDRSRRYEMGKIAGDNADLTIVTMDNPRYELPDQIIKDIESGIKKTKGNYKIIPDRKEAIQYAIVNRKKGDVIVIAGKGHETYQEIEGIRYDMDDRQIVTEIIGQIIE